VLETGVEEVAAAEKINPSYVSRILRLTLLAPTIVEAILDGRHPPERTIANLMEPFPLTWDQQPSALQRNAPHRRTNAKVPR
jgi:hypothetical protein